MVKRTIFVLIALVLSVLCAAQEGAPTPKDFYKYPNFAPGAGYEMNFSSSATYFSFPIELRLFSVENDFNFAIGERITLRNAHQDENTEQNYTYYCTLLNPYINYEQYSTYVNARWNVIRFCDTNILGVFVGLGYYFNVNTNGKVFIDAPTQTLSNLMNDYTWREGTGWQLYRCEELLNRTSHSLRLELGFTTPGFEISIFGMMALTNPVNLDVASSTLYYDRKHNNNQLSTSPVNDLNGADTYLPITLSDYVVLRQDLKTLSSVGFSIKAHMFTGYWKKLFKK